MSQSESNEAVAANFLQFLSGLAMQALIHLGAMSNPITGKTEVDLKNAKYTIDLLGIIQEKTRGNLSADEERYLQAALTDLRLRYVRAVEKPSTAGDADAEKKSP